MNKYEKINTDTFVKGDITYQPEGMMVFMRANHEMEYNVFLNKTNNQIWALSFYSPIIVHRDIEQSIKNIERDYCRKYLFNYGVKISNKEELY